MNLDRRYLTFPTSLLLAIILLMTLATANLRILFSLNYIDWRYERLQETGALAPEWPTVTAAAPILSFINNDLNALPGLTERETSHLVDVRTIRTRAYSSTLAGAAALVIAALLLTATSSRRQFARLLRQATLGAAALLGLALLASMIDFNWIFDSGHALVFAPDTWLFNSDSTLMRLFPPPFWRSAVSDLAFLTLFELAAITGLTYVFDRESSGQDDD